MRINILLAKKRHDDADDHQCWPSLLENTQQPCSFNTVAKAGIKNVNNMQKRHTQRKIHSAGGRHGEISMNKFDI